MKFKPLNTACILDIGQTSVKVLMAKRGRNMPMVHAKYELEQEGFLDSAELYGESGIVKWLKELKLEKLPIAVVVPQYMCTTKVLNEYPKNASDDTLQTLVEAETFNLAGLSGESFVSDFQRMKPVYSAENPVLTGFCRQQIPEQTSQQLESTGLLMSNASMGGIAVANALFALHPETELSMEPQVILDIGKETTTCVVVLAGNILNTTSLMAGADSCENGVETLFNELKNAMDIWKSSELQDIAEHFIDGIWLCGGGANIQGLDCALSELCNCKVTVFGPVFEGNVACPEFAAAYGLAMQELGMAKYSLSLAPDNIRWRRTREDRFTTLAAACALFFIMLFSILLTINHILNTDCALLKEKIENLRRCDSIIPKLDNAISEIEYQQLLLTPIVELGNRSKLYMRSLEEISHSISDDDWCIYFSDQYSHKEYGQMQDEKSKISSTSKKKKNAGLFGTHETEQESAQVENNTKIVLSQLPLLSYLVTGGYTVPNRNNDTEKYKGRYGAVLKIQEKLMHKDAGAGNNSEGMFSNVDWLNENKDWTGREAEVSRPWNAYLKNNRNYMGDYTEFKLKLQLSKLSVDMPQQEAASK